MLAFMRICRVTNTTSFYDALHIKFSQHRVCLYGFLYSLQTFVHETKKTNKYTGRIHTHTHTQKHSIKHFNLYKGNNKVCNQLIGLCFSRKKKINNARQITKKYCLPKTTKSTMETARKCLLPKKYPFFFGAFTPVLFWLYI